MGCSCIKDLVVTFLSPERYSEMTDRDDEVATQSNNQPPAFEIDARVKMVIEFELAVNLGKLVLESDTKNTALLALGHQLRNLSNVRAV